MTRRSIFLKNESYSDVQTALAKANTEEEYRHLLSERAKSNGWTAEAEIEYQKHLRTCGFAGAFQRAKENPLGKNTTGRTQARLLHDALAAERHHSGVLKTDTVET